MTRRKYVIAVAAALLAVLSGGSALAGTTKTYRDPQGRFSFQIPSYWQVRQLAGPHQRLELSGGEGAACLWTVVQGNVAPADGQPRFTRILSRMGQDFPRAYLPYDVTRFRRTTRRTRLDGEPAQIYEGAYRTEAGLEGRLDVFVAFRPFGTLIISCTHDFEQIVWPEAAEQFRLIRETTRFPGDGAYAIAARYRILTTLTEATTRGH